MLLFSLNERIPAEAIAVIDKDQGVEESGPVSGSAITKSLPQLRLPSCSMQV